MGLAVLSPGGCSGVKRRWRGRRAALTDYPSCPQEGTLVSISATSVWPRICRNSDVGGSGQGRVYVCEGGSVPQASRVVGTRGSLSSLSRVGDFDNLGKVPAEPLSGWVCLWPEKARLYSSRSARSVAPEKQERRGCHRLPDRWQIASHGVPGFSLSLSSAAVSHALCKFHLLSVFY